MTAQNATYVCFDGPLGTAAKRGTECPSVLHDWPLPTGYIEASDEADWRLDHQWSSTDCETCGQHGWAPGVISPAHVRRPLDEHAQFMSDVAEALESQGYEWCKVEVPDVTERVQS